MECTTTTSLAELVNKIPNEPFKLEQGIISPYIFIICTEY